MSGSFTVSGKFTLIDRFTRPLASMEGRLARFGRVGSQHLERIDRGFEKLGHTTRLAKAGLIASAGGMALAAKEAMSVQDAMAKVQTVILPAAGTIQAALDKTKRAAIEWSNAHVQGVEDFLEANYNMASAGLNSEQALAGTESALRLATAAMGDAVTAGNLLATVYNNMGDKSANAQQEFDRLGDILAKTQQIAQIADLGQLNESLKMGVPAALQYGVSIEQLSTVLGQLNTAGLQGGMAGTSFSASMRQMIKASRALHFEIAKTSDGGVDFVGTLKNIEKKYGSFAKMTDRQKLAFQKAFGDEGVRAISLLLPKTAELAANLEKVAGSTGAAGDQQKILEATGLNMLRIRGNRIRNSLGAAGDSLLEGFEKAAPGIDKLVSSFDKWAKVSGVIIGQKLGEVIEWIAKNAESLTKWLKWIGYAAAGFYTLAVGVKLARLAMVAYNTAVWLGTAAVWSYTKAKDAATWATRRFGKATKASQLELFAMEGQTVATGKGLAGMRGALNASRLGGMINGVTGKLGQAGLLAAALGVGVAIGSWLDHEFAISQMLEGWLTKITGIEEGIAAAGGRASGRGTGDGSKVYADGTVVDAQGNVVTRGTGDPALGPKLVTPQDQVSREIKESTTTNQDKLAVEIKDGTGKAQVTKAPKRAGLKVRHSGAF